MFDDTRVRREIFHTTAHEYAHHLTVAEKLSHGPQWQKSFGDILTLLAPDDVIGVGCTDIPNLVQKQFDGVDLYVEESLDAPNFCPGWLKREVDIAGTYLRCFSSFPRRLPEPQLNLVWSPSSSNNGFYRDQCIWINSHCLHGA